ncbi:hypothetical protein R70723_15025 [Paenibacillus sp. FSL R7-0273]|uniref:stalk domain-containing protein n=1 Tax=Paenibacillus sp. FSL R7-0273 TaxID=1536772 RepID=UPI0004F66104|nr:stalk domain-containing protein [Paenibacillus sp. FSL R7-0273]AIQ47047.1 hypothetical protein R70723_15025 [Paenibacillus sp. FSL R7-0273]OMF97198.1 hypothetical protein BK144_00605 [Paenibacillus sp. FSL R7-0273]
MKSKVAAVILSILLLAAGTGIWTVNEAKAAAGLSVVVNGQAVQLADSSTYKNGTNVLVPLREVAEALKYKITYKGSTGTVQLSRAAEIIEFRLGNKEIILADKQKVAYEGTIETRQGRLYVPLSFLTSLGLVAGYNPLSNLAEIYSPEVTAGAVTTLLATGQYEELQKRYISGGSQTADLPLIRQSWEQVAGTAGNYMGVKSAVSTWKDDAFIIESTLAFSSSEAVLTLIVDNTGKLTALKLAPAAAEKAQANPH